MDILIGIDSYSPGDQDLLLYYGQGTPDVEFAGAIVTQTGPIDTGSRCYPSVFDLDEDGRFDLLVGGYYSGYPDAVGIYMNQGTALPDFTGYSLLMTGSSVFTVPGADPEIGDLTGDGLPDAVIGTETGHALLILENTGSAGNPVFSSVDTLLCDGSTLETGNYARPCICDWNADGCPDLLVGDKDGRVKIYLGSILGIAEETGSITGESFQIQIDNPVRYNAKVRLDLSEPSDLNIALVSMNGNVIESINTGMIGEGIHSFELSTTGLPRGVYILHVSGSGSFCSRQITLIAD